MIPQNRTKIVSTIGPACSSKETLEELIGAGVDMARFNFSHGEYCVFDEWLKNIRRISREKNQSVAILQDLQGPRIRVGGDVPKKGVLLKQDSIVSVGFGKYKKNFIPIDYKDLVKDIKVGTRILLVDGLVELEVVKAGKSKAEAKVIMEGKIYPRKGVNIPNAKLSIATITEKDKKDLEWGVDHDVDYVGLSFVRSAKDIKDLKKLILKRNKNSKTKVIAKIEKQEAMDNLDKIMKEVDGVMIARGDLGIELPAEEVPVAQKKIILAAIEHSKPVITATQMMESMITNPRPTRAEVSDVANAILDGTDAIMLSGETATGKFPVRVVKMMTKIVTGIEEEIFGTKKLNFENISKSDIEELKKGCEKIASTDAVGLSVREVSSGIEAKYIVTATLSGYSARMVSRNRPETPIVAVSPDKKVVDQLALVWGVRSFYIPMFHTADELMQQIGDLLKHNNLVKKGDMVVIVSSHPVGKSGKTNLIKIQEIK